MAKTKVYGTMGLYDWSPLIRVGHASYSPHFEGGTVDKNGVTPARYTTSNRVEQSIIESSDYYKSGRIFIMSQFGEDEPTASELEAAAAQAAAEGTSEESAELTPMEFASVGDAAEYLSETYGLAKSGLRSVNAVHEAGVANGLNITITK
jgi:hypothetical protein